ncbi:hypothetical protein [Botryobacter ruber]|uniref:hypothetical protein n=1 Tax=Botryobacter ruber TaxID=2171629 RepID=UPI0013E3BC7C|nr:hypothetical protein [Botryobacter ruber]
MNSFIRNLTRRKSVSALLADYQQDGHVPETNLVRTLRLKDWSLSDWLVVEHLYVALS